ncbi:MAG: HNH endonuclease signature motif containing protein [Acidimicrobiales bacterium]
MEAGATPQRSEGRRAEDRTPGPTAAGVRAELRQVVAAFEPELVSATDAAGLVGVFGEIERLAAAGRLLAAARMATTSVWAGEGDTDVASWMARTTGQSRADAKKDLAAARALDELDDTRDALRQGRLTKEQVREVAPAAAMAPGQEGDLLQEAATGSVERLAHKARATKAAARRDGRDAVERMRRRRSVTHGRADDGSAWVRASGPPDDVARILAGLSPWERAARGEARQRGESLTDEQARFDSLVAMAAQPRVLDDCDDELGEDRAGDHDDDPAGDDDRGDDRGRPDGDGLVSGSLGDDRDLDHGDDDVDDLVGRDLLTDGPGAEPSTGHGDDVGELGRSCAGQDDDDPSGNGARSAGDRAGPPTGRRGSARSRDRRRRRDGTPRWATKVIVNIDLQALRRGFALPGERCSITEVGEVPVATVHDLLDREDTFLAAVLRDGEDIQKVAHLGRGPTARQRTALEARHDRCCIDGCPDPPKVVDHHHPFAGGGPRTLANLGPLCARHDGRKTNQGWVLVRHGTSRRLVPPDHPLAGAAPGGCVDLDDPAGIDDAPSGEPSGPADTGRPAPPNAGHRSRRRSSEQLDLLAG